MPTRKSKRKELRTLLESMFTTESDFRTFISDWYDSILGAVSFTSGRDTAVSDFVDAADINGLLDGEFFDILDDERPGRSSDIRRVRTLWFPPTLHGSGPAQSHMAGSQPFLDRQGLRAFLESALDGAGDRLLLITGGKDSGKTHTFSLMAHVEALNDGFRPWMYDFARDGIPGAGELADLLAEEMDLAIPAWDEIEGMAPRRTNRWLRNFDRQARTLEKTWCLFFDSMHKVHVPEATVDLIEGLAVLVDLVRMLPLRIVLPGIERSALRAPKLREVADVEPLAGLSRKHVHDYLAAVAVDSGKTVASRRLFDELDKRFGKGMINPAALHRALDGLAKMVLV